MKFLFFKMLVVWRRFRHGMQARYMNRQDVGRQLDVLMRRIEPTSSWHERANWMIDVGEWLRHRPKVSLMDKQRWHRVRRYRLDFLLDWLDQHRDVKRTVQNALQKTLREVGGHELFSTTGLPHEPGFFGELGERLARMILPRHLSPTDLSSLFTAMFPDPDDAEWLLQLDNETMSRLWKLLADDGISHMYWQQIEEAMTYLTTTIVADGISPAFRQRLEPKMPLRATPFLALRREMDTYLRGSPHDQGAVRSVRMLVAVCHAQTDRIYEHLDEYGVSVSLVYRIERMRAHLARIGRLIELRSAVPTEGGAGRGQLLLADLISAHHNRSSVRGLMRRSFSLLARKMVERNADHGEHYIARDAAGYRAVMKAAAWGGVVVSAIVLAKVMAARWGNVHLGQFFEGLLASTGYAAGFLLIAAIGGVLATRQPAITAPALASRMGDIASTDGLRALLNEAAQLLRSQSAGIFGNVLTVVPLVGAVGAGVWLGLGTPLMTPEQARASIASLSLVGRTPLYAALTGVLLWVSSLAAGFVDNWFALRQVHEVIANQRRLVHTLGQMRAERVAAWMERNIAVIAGNVSLGILLGMAPVLANFFSLPFDIRHVALAAGAMAAAVSSLGWPTLMTPEFWLAAGGVVLTGLLSVGVAFSCALALALRARDVPRRMRRFVLRAVLRRFTLAPGFFIFPDRHAEKINAATHKRTAAVDASSKAKRQERPRNQPAELVDDD